MVAATLAFLAKIGIGSIATKLANAYVAKEAAKTDLERLQSEERIKQLEARQAVQVAEGASPINGMIRAGFALPFVIYNAKLVIWDKVLALGVTDALSPELVQVEMAAIGFYFLSETSIRIARVVKGR